MKGIMFNLLEGFVSEKSGLAAWNAVLANCDLTTKEPGIMVGPGTYPDEDFFELIQKSAAYLNLTPDTLLIDLGKYALPKLALRYPKFFNPYNHPRDFLKFTGMIHQTEVKKLYKNAQTPHFVFCELDENCATLRYHSKRHYGRLVEGLLHGLGKYYHTSLTVEMVEEQKTGDDPFCEFKLHFAEK